MKKNIGHNDKIIRLLLGAGLIIYGVDFKSWIGFIAVIPILTALVNMCTIYSLLGINTCQIHSKVQVFC